MAEAKRRSCEAGGGPARSDRRRWYDYDADGCLYERDGSQWTGASDRSGSQVAAQTSPAGWNGPDVDGCSYEWKGVQRTGARVCKHDGVQIVVPAVSTAQPVLTTTTIGGTGLMDGVEIVVPPPSSGGGDFCRPNLGRMLTDRLSEHPMSPGDVRTLLEPNRQPAYSPGCEVVLEDDCYTASPNPSGDRAQP